jgi:NitT/TauT family transport system permease protein
MRTRISVRLTRYALLLGALGSWEIGGRTGAIDPFFFPLPSSIIAQVAEWAATPRIYADLAITLTETALGFGVGTLLGVMLGLWLGLSPFASQVLEPFIKAFNAIPRIVLAPIFALWFGLGLASKVAIVVTLVFFMAFFNTYQGVRDVNPVVLANAKLLRARGGLLLRHVYLPSAAQWILSSLRASIGFAVTGAVVGEYLGSAAGIGHVIAQAEGSFDAVGVFAGLTVLGLFVLLLDAGISVVEHRVIVWRPGQEQRGG